VSTERHVGPARSGSGHRDAVVLRLRRTRRDRLSSVLGQLAPVARHEPPGHRAAVRQRAPAGTRPDRAGPGRAGGVGQIEPMHPGSVHASTRGPASIAVDGERELTSGRARSRPCGCGGRARCVDVPAVLAASARLGLLASNPPTRRRTMTDTVERKTLTPRHLLTSTDDADNPRVESGCMRSSRPARSRVRPPVRGGGGVSGRRLQHLDDRTPSQNPPGHGHCIARGVTSAR